MGPGSMELGLPVAVLGTDIDLNVEFVKVPKGCRTQATPRRRQAHRRTGVRPGLG